eukprot:9291396-Alexandrium_andersonii.AAC.1
MAKAQQQHKQSEGTAQPHHSQTTSALTHTLTRAHAHTREHARTKARNHASTRAGSHSKAQPQRNHTTGMAQARR